MWAHSLSWQGSHGVMAAGDWKGRSHRIHTLEAERDESRNLAHFLLLFMAPARGMILTCSPHQLIQSRDPSQSHPKFNVHSDSQSHQTDKIYHHSKAEGWNSFLFNRSSTKLIIFIRPLPGPSTPNTDSSKWDCFQVVTVMTETLCGILFVFLINRTFLKIRE